MSKLNHPEARVEIQRFVYLARDLSRELRESCNYEEARRNRNVPLLVKKNSAYCSILAIPGQVAPVVHDNLHVYL